MADISHISINGTTYDIKDSVAREALQGLTGSMHWLGITTTALTDGAKTAAVVIGEETKTAVNGDVVGYGQLEFIFNGTAWQEFGSTGSLKALAFKATASGKITPAGTNAASSVTLTGGSTSKLVTTSITPVNGTESVSKVTKTASKLVTTSVTPVSGTESVSKVTKTASKLVTTSITPVNGTEKLHDTPTLNKENVGSASGWSAGTMFSATVSGETLTLTPGSTPSLTITTKSVGTSLTAGAEKTVAKAGTATTVATGAVDANGTGSDIVTGVTIADKTVAKAGTAVTVATGSAASDGEGTAIVTGVTVADKTVAKAGTAVDVATGAVSESGAGASVATALPTGGTAAAQKFTGTEGTVTVS